jgi:hypothetical protein
MKTQINLKLIQLDDYNKTLNCVFNLLDSITIEFAKNNPDFVKAFLEDLQLYTDIMLTEMPEDEEGELK